MARADTFREMPQAVWQWYSERRDDIERASPNAAHTALVDLALASPDFLLVAQNVDDLDRRAGMPDEKFVQIHGDIFSVHCRACSFRGPDRGRHVDDVPRCPRCHGPMGPGVVWFDEDFDPAREARLNEFLARGPCDLVLVAGTSVPFVEVRDWVMAGKGSTGILIEVNLEPTVISPHAEQVIRQDAAAALPALVAQLMAGAHPGSPGDQDH